MRHFPSAVRASVAATLVVLLYGLVGCSKPHGDLTGLNTGAMANLQVVTSPSPQPTTVFHDAKGGAHTLAEFKGRVLVLNLWANWCAPCKEEIPSLARLQTEFAGRDVAVVPVSVGKGDDETKGQAFLAQNPPLVFYTEPTYALAFAFKPTIEGMPTTIIYDRSGVERARLSGGADWSGPDARKVIEALLRS